jgi:hypothetical protein
VESAGIRSDAFSERNMPHRVSANACAFSPKRPVSSDRRRKFSSALSLILNLAVCGTLTSVSAGVSELLPGR